jgi:hypothetical protein
MFADKGPYETFKQLGKALKNQKKGMKRESIVISTLLFLFSSFCTTGN